LSPASCCPTVGAAALGSQIRGSRGAVPRAAERDGAAATRVPELPLEILPAGISPPDAGEFVASDALARVLADVADRADLVLIDAPPLLRVGDPLALARNVDAVLVVTRLDAIDRSTLDELVRVLESLPTEKLGFIATGAERDEGFAYASSDRT
jgi:Mrp family chromosome partitioning ATPase